MEILTTEGWEDYQLLDTGNGERLEKFGRYTLVRPDPQICWQPTLSKTEWDNADAIYVKTGSDKGIWKKKNAVPHRWKMTYKDIMFWAEPTPFKHTGVFPEQHLQWDWMRKQIREARRSTHVLNLFAYTGIASVAAAAEGAKVTHVDASKPSVTWARDNQIASGIADKPIRWIIDDAIKFTSREVKRGVKYDGIIMDPPIYGHGPNGERWDFMKDMPKLLANCEAILSDKPLFIIINAYAISASAFMLGNLIADFTKKLTGKIEVGELVLQEKSAKRPLSTGIYTRWNAL